MAYDSVWGTPVAVLDGSGYNMNLLDCSLTALMKLKLRMGFEEIGRGEVQLERNLLGVCVLLQMVAVWGSRAGYI